MSSAWYKLKCAVHILAGAEPPRERLLHCYTYHLADIRLKDLPPEIRGDFSLLALQLSRGPGQSAEDVKQAVEAISDEDVMAMIHSIIDMYDAVTRYQPLPRGCRNSRQDHRHDCRNVPD
jgi:hypothetical protein